MDWEVLVEKAGAILEKEPRLIDLPSQGKAVLVGDTHGDLEATEKVIGQYLRNDNRLIFLGDYVDRGDRSEENIRTLVRMKVEFPESVFLLAGNHEGYRVKRFFPADFWNSLSEKDQETYGRLFSRFPIAAASENGVIALHGALPDVESLEGINRIRLGDDQWNRILWGDFVDNGGDVLEEWGGRPQFGGAYFRRMMDRYQKQVLIRSHQPQAPQKMFKDRCVTLFTSRAYLMQRTIAVLDLGKEIRTAKDLVLHSL